MTQDNTELLPCPFCGRVHDSRTSEIATIHSVVAGWWVKCDCSAATLGHATEAEAITAWNTRTTQGQDALVEALKRADEALSDALSDMQGGGLSVCGAVKKFMIEAHADVQKALLTNLPSTQAEAAPDDGLVIAPAYVTGDMDCTRACVATILGKQTADVPNFYRMADGEGLDHSINMKAAIRDYLRTIGLASFETYCSGDWSLEKVIEWASGDNPGCPIILHGTPNNNDAAHSVVLLDGKIAHDPSGAGIVGPVECSDGKRWWFLEVICATALRARPSGDVGWQPIETAPKDGTRILAAKFGWTPIMGDLKQGSAEWKARFFDPNTPKEYRLWWMTMAWWSEQWNCWFDGQDPSGLSGPTHYIPCASLSPPEPPALSTIKGEG